LEDGRWFSFSNEGAISNKKLLGQIYQNELAIALQQHGYTIEPKAHGQFELVGYSPELLKLFSTRRQQIESLVALWEAEGKTVFSGDGRVLRSRLALYEAAALKSRKRKPTPMQPEQLIRGWNGLVQLEDLTLPALPESSSKAGEEQSLYSKADKGFEVEFSPPTSTVAINSEIEPAIQHCSEREAVFRRTALERFVFEHQLGQQSFDQLQQAIEGSLELVRIDEIRMTTQAAIRLELETIRLMREGQGVVGAIAPLSQINERIEGRSLTVEQRLAIQRVMTVPDTVMAWQGSAGVGKTYALSEVGAIAQFQGYQVKGFAPSAEAAHTLGEALQIETGTVAGLLVSQDQEKGRSLWIIDEAGLLSMKDAHALLQRAKQENARVLLVGDTKQLSAVEAGNPFKSLQAGGITLARLDNSLRQKTEALKVAVQLIAEGKVARGVDVLEQAGCLQIEPEPSQQMNQMVRDYLQLSPAERENTLLLAGTNQERGLLTKQLRQALQAEGSLSENQLTVLSLRRKDLTLAQAKYLSAYALGDVLIPTQDYKKQGLAKYQHYTVRKVDHEARQLVVETAAGQLIEIDPARCERKAVYGMQPIAIAVGDQLRWTKNDRAAKTRNGQPFTVTEISAEGKVRTVDERGESRWFELSGRQHVDYAWVSTTYGSQGKTADRVLALMGEKTMNREAFYVAVSRAKHGLMLYAADKHELINRAQVSRAKENASDYVPLFEAGEQYAETSKENRNADERASVGRAMGQYVGERLAQEFAADAGGHSRPHSAGAISRARDTTVSGDLESVADSLSGQVESLSGAVAAHVERAEFVECEGFFAAAVAAVNCGFEQLECAAQNRDQLTATVDRFDAAVGRQAQQQQGRQAVTSRSIRGEFLVDQVGSDLQSEGTSLRGRKFYLELWRNYSTDIQAHTSVELDYLAGRAAFAHGCNRKDIALMLAAGSAMAKQIRVSQGAKQATDYVNKTVLSVCQEQPSIRMEVGNQQKREIGLGD
jgi:ATP-dependent exoDNAse (exonuclease V) alpha subunit